MVRGSGVVKFGVMAASGTFGYDGYGGGMPEDGSLSILDAVVLKTATLSSRLGNPEPRWYPSSFRAALSEGDHGLLNSVGLTNPGLEFVLSDELPRWTAAGASVVISLSADTIADWMLLAAMVDSCDGDVLAIEMNLSCPNVDRGSLFADDVLAAREITAACRAETSLPLWAKLSPNFACIEQVAAAAAESGADAMVVCNSFPAMRVVPGTGRSVLGTDYGGLTGPSVRPMVMALVHRVAGAVSVPVVAVGGVVSGGAALDYLNVGASAVQVGSASLADPSAPFWIREELSSMLSAPVIPSR